METASSAPKQRASATKRRGRKPKLIHKPTRAVELPPKPAKRTPRTPAEWAKMREIYETTTTPTTTIAANFGMRSDGSLRRKIVEENWKRDIEGITAHLTTRAVALGDDEADSQNKDASAHPRASANQQKSHDVSGDGAATIPPAHSRATAKERPRTAEDIDVRTARGLAEIHAKAIREQVAQGEKVAEIGLLILERLSEVVSSDDPQRVADARTRLLMLNPDKETLAGIVKVAAFAVERGQAIKRRALGMDVVKGSSGVLPRSEGDRPGVPEALKNLPADILQRLRATAQEISRLPPKPPTIDIPDATIVEGEVT